jgi:hypothetical protein
MADDYAASIATTGSVAIGGSITGSIETSGDVDWIKVTLAAGTTYEFDLTAMSLAGQPALPSPLLGLLGTVGNQIGQLVTTGGPGGPGIKFCSGLPCLRCHNQTETRPFRPNS